MRCWAAPEALLLFWLEFWRHFFPPNGLCAIAYNFFLALWALTVQNIPQMLLMGNHCDFCNFPSFKIVCTLLRFLHNWQRFIWHSRITNGEGMGWIFICQYLKTNKLTVTVRINVSWIFDKSKQSLNKYFYELFVFLY